MDLRPGGDRLIGPRLGALALAAALATSSTPAFAATTYGDPAFHATKQRTDTLVGLSREIQASAIQKARMRPEAPKLTSDGPPSAGISDLELDHTCGEWFIMWEEDGRGNPILGTFQLYCGGGTIPIG